MVSVAAGNAAARPDAAAADRRRDDLPAAHRGADRAGLRPPHGARARRLAGRRRRVRPARPGPGRQARRCQPRRPGAAPHRARRQAAAPAAAALAGAGQPARWSASTTCAVPSFTGTRLVAAGPAPAARADRLAVLLPRLGAERQVPGHPGAACGQGAVRRRERAARRDHRTAGCCGRAASTASGPRTRTATTSWSRAGAARFPMLRQQAARTDDRPNRCLADFVAPAGRPHRRVRRLRRRRRGAGRAGTKTQHDDYRAITVKALADRLAEACAEYVHLEARRAWYEPAFEPTLEELHAERFRGIRPAFGYPACPDHSEKRKLVDLLDAEPDRHGADRVVRDDAGRERERPAARRIPPPATSPSAGSAGTRSRITPAART